MYFRLIGNEFEWHKEGDGWVKGDQSSLAIERIIAAKGPRVVDTETTGLKWYKGERVFSIALQVEETVYYINFSEYPSDLLFAFEADWVFKDKERLRPIFSSPQRWVGHNLKFDWHMLNAFGFKLLGEFHDTMIVERLLDNDQMSYSLENCVKRRLPTMAKDDAVEKYIDDFGLYSYEDIPGRKQKFKNKFYWLVPFRIICPYAMNDVVITAKLYEDQLQRQSLLTERPITRVVELEAEVFKLACEIEQTGIFVDQEYCAQGLKYEEERAQKVEREFKEQFGAEFVDSAERLAPIFEKLGFTLGRTDAGADSIAATFLEGCSHPLARMIEAHRDAVKRANTYFRNFINLSDSGHVLHADMKQTGTRTGRFSYSDPNLQNIPAEDDSVFPIRRALIPRPGYFFLSIDYAQQEFRMMLDYAGEVELIEKIKQGHDPHQATADLTGLTRKAAKSLNFGLMYGMGLQKLANQIGVSYDEAKAFKAKYFQALPKVKKLIYLAMDTAKHRGFVTTWLGRRCLFPNPDFAYKAINAVIQGGCADVTKRAMVAIREKLAGKKSRILLQVHDELLFEVALDEANLIPMFQNEMQMAYRERERHISLTTTLAYSLQSFHDLIEVESVREIYQALGAGAHSEGEKVLGLSPQNMEC